MFFLVDKSFIIIISVEDFKVDDRLLLQNVIVTYLKELTGFRWIKEEGIIHTDKGDKKQIIEQKLIA